MKKFDYPNIDQKKTGSNIKDICKKRNISVREIQNCLHIASNQAIYDWFNGKNMPSLDNLIALSKLLEVSIEELVVLKEKQ